MSAKSSFTDAETRVTDEDHDALRLWLRLYACSNLIEAQVRRRLQTRFGITLAKFDFLAQLDRNPQGLRMSELSERLMVTGGNVTGLADTLVKEGLVTRAVDDQDRRALRVRVTREGRKVFRSMASAHEQWIVALFDGLPERTQRTLNEQLTVFKRQVLSNIRKQQE